MQGKRLERVNQLIKEEISMVLQRELKDPRLGFVSVTEVDVTPDLKYAKVYVSVLGPEERWASSLASARSRCSTLASPASAWSNLGLLIMPPPGNGSRRAAASGKPACLARGEPRETLIKSRTVRCVRGE